MLNFMFFPYWVYRSAVLISIGLDYPELNDFAVNSTVLELASALMFDIIIIEFIFLLSLF